MKSEINRCDLKLGSSEINDLPQINSRNTITDDLGRDILKLSLDDVTQQDILIYDQNETSGNYLNVKIGKYLKNKTWRKYKNPQ